jgi:hypothetical protein
MINDDLMVSMDSFVSNDQDRKVFSIDLSAQFEPDLIMLALCFDNPMHE